MERAPVITAKRRISPVYLLDAAVEAALLAGWAVAEARGRHTVSE
ncbi:hypothetical protein [Cystobacter ferrugineus]|nr:hypothetical protein [Cystobacter ferrugineus]